MTADTNLARRATKGERTRQRLKDATFAVLVRLGYHATTIAEIAAEARMAIGTIYIYYPDRERIIEEVLLERFEAMIGTIYAGPRHDDPYDDLLEVVRRFFEHLERSGPVNKVFLDAAEAIPALRAAWRATNAHQAERVAARLARRAGPDVSHRELLFTAHAMQELVDVLAISYYARDPALVYLGGSTDAFAERVARLCFRLLYARDPADRDAAAEGGPQPA